jgi:hypothetical protein
MTALTEVGPREWADPGASGSGAAATCRTTSPSTVELPVQDLEPGVSPRSRPLCGTHVSLLVELRGNWPPIVVRRGDHLIIDGHHRVEAARRLRLHTITGQYFEGSDDEAYLESVRLNVRHGLVLSMAERRAAARLILDRHPDWADRRVASICGLSRGTVGEVRRVTSLAGEGRPDGGFDRLDRRVGSDGRSRPVNAGALRARIAELVAQDPSASLRSVARMAGASPETVRAVRHELQSTGASYCPPDPAPVEVPQAFGSTDPGREFFEWFTKTHIGRGDADARASGIPLNRVYEVADEARRRAALWQAFAELVEGRAR